MAKYTPKIAHERAEKFEKSWQENSPDKEWADGTLVDFKGERQAIPVKEDEIAASEAHTKALQIQRDNLNSDLMKECDYVAADVEGDRNFGPDSALYGGFGYICKSERKRATRKPKALPKG